MYEACLPTCVLLSFYLSAKRLIVSGYLNKGFYMSVHALLDLLNELAKRDNMRGLISSSQRV